MGGMGLRRVPTSIYSVKELLRSMPLKHAMIHAFTAAVVLLAASTSFAESPGPGPVLSPSQATPAAFAASLPSCPANVTELTDQPHASSSCAFLPLNFTTTLQPGPPATLPLHTALMGASSTGNFPAACCDPSSSSAPFPSPPQHGNATTNTTATSLSQLDLSRLAPSSLVVPPNGTLSLHHLTITAAQLPTAPYPLTATSFLSLLAIRLSPGARLQLSSVTITTTSCASLALHQDLACRSAPSPNFTVTPTSLLVHSYTTASLAAQDVLLTCSGRQLPAPCIAAVMHSGAELLREAWAWEQQGDSLSIPLYMYVQGTAQLRLPAVHAISGSGNSSSTANMQDGSPLDTMDVWEEVQKVFPGSASLPISRGTLVLAGPPDRSSVLDLYGSSSLFSIQGSGVLRLQHLTLRGLPLGPPEDYPKALLRLPMWFAPASQPWIGGGPRAAKLAVSNVTVELPPEEVAYWRDARDIGKERWVEVPYPEGSDGDSAQACITDSGKVFSRLDLAAVPGCSGCLLAQLLRSLGGLLEIRDTLLMGTVQAVAPPRPPLVPPLLSPQQQQQQQQGLGGQQQQQQQQGSSGASNNQPGRTGQQQGPDLFGGLRLPPAPSSPLCSLAPGPGATEAELLHRRINDAYLNAMWGRPMGPSPPPFPSLPALSPTSWRRRQLPPPYLDYFEVCGGVLTPSQLSHTLQPTFNQFTAYSTLLNADTQADAGNSRFDLDSFLREQAVVELPGTLLLGDPVRVRTLDLAGLPSAVVLEREPLASAPSTWPIPDVLLPLLDSVRQERQAAGWRGLLTEPVSLTVRHLVLINLPAAGPFVRIPAPPGAPSFPSFPAFAGWEPPEQNAGPALMTESPKAIGVRVVAGRGLRQAPQPSAMRDESVTVGAGIEAEAGADAVHADYLGGLPPSLANLTSCVWSLQLDRAAVVRAVRDRLQQGGTDGGGGAGNNSSDMQSPVDVSYVLLQSVQLVVPERELLLLAWAWATNATRHAAHPGLAEQLQLMLDGSRLAGGAGELLQQQLLQGPSGSPGGQPAPTLPSGLRLVYDQFVWCGLLGTNVTLTSQLPGPTPLSLQLPDLDLPMAYSAAGSDDNVRGAPGQQEGGETAAPVAVVGPLPPPVVVVGPPSPGAGTRDQADGGPRAPAAEKPGLQGPTGADAGATVPPGNSNGGVLQPGTSDRGGGGGGGGSSVLPTSIGLAVGLGVGCAAIALVAMLLVMRKRRGTRSRDKLEQELRTVVTGYGAGAGGFAGPEDEAGPDTGGIKQEQQQTQQEQQQQDEAEVSRGGSGGISWKPQSSASATSESTPMQLRQRESAGAYQLGKGNSTTEGDIGRGSSAGSVPKAMPGIVQDETHGSLSLDLAAASSSGGGLEAPAAAKATIGAFMGAFTAARATTAESGMGRPADGRGNDSGGNSSSGPPLVLLQELGRGAEGMEVPWAPHVEHTSGPPVSPRMRQRLTELRLNIEGKRRLVLVRTLEQRQDQQQEEVPHRASSGVGIEPPPLASCTPQPTPVQQQQQQQQRVAGGASPLAGGQVSRGNETDGDAGRGSSVGRAGLLMAQDSVDGSLSLDLAPAPSSGGGLEASAYADTSGVFKGTLASASATAGGHKGMAAGGGRNSSNNANSSSTSSGGPPLVLLRELGRGAQGVVYAGRWRGLDVAVKSVLVQRLRGSLDGGSWHGPSLHSALAEGSISSAMSHPHVVATYATYVQGPEGEEQGVVGEQEAEEGEVAAAGMSSRGRRCSNATAAAALEDISPEGTCPMHGDAEPGSREDAAATAMVGSGCNDAAMPSAPTARAVPGPVLEPAQGQVQQQVNASQGFGSSAGPPTPGAAVAQVQVQVWKLTLVQELCTGGSLRDSLLAGRLARRGGEPWPRALHPAAALRLALHVARGTAHLHRHGVLWNDLSSANVLLQLGRQGGGAREAAGADSTGSSGGLDFVAKVADFGLSKRLPEGATHASETAGRSGLYVAPEVVRYGRCTPASDVYAYGVLLWEVAAGVPLPELLSQPEGGAVRSWLAQQAFVPPEEAEALPAELLAWPGAGQQRTGSLGEEAGEKGNGDAVGNSVDVDVGSLLPAGYVALAEQCLRQDPTQRPRFEGVCLRLERILEEFSGM